MGRYLFILSWSLFFALLSPNAFAVGFEKYHSQEYRPKLLSERKCKTTLKHAKRVARNLDYGAAAGVNNFLYQDHQVKRYDILGDLHYQGCKKAELSVDKPTAAYWFTVGATLHIPESQFKLGKMLYEGDGIPQDENAGLIWLTSAALEGNNAAFNYLSGLGISLSPPSGPNTYAVVKANADAFWKQDRKDSWKALGSGLLDLAIVAGSVYLAYEGISAQSNSFRGPSMPQTTIGRTTPVWCTSVGTALISDFGFDGLVTGTTTTFCN